MISVKTVEDVIKRFAPRTSIILAFPANAVATFQWVILSVDIEDS